jgi:hypothetical protein
VCNVGFLAKPVTRAPDPKRLARARRELEHDHRPQSAGRYDSEIQRISEADEQAIADDAREQAATQARTSAYRQIADLRVRLDELGTTMAVATPGVGHRDALRMGRRVFDALERSLPKE